MPRTCQVSEQLGLGDRNEEIARLRLALVAPHLAVVDDLAWAATHAAFRQPVLKPWRPVTL